MKKVWFPWIAALCVLLYAVPACAIRVEGQLTDPDGNRLIMLGGALLLLSMWRLWRNDRKNRRK